MTSVHDITTLFDTLANPRINEQSGVIICSYTEEYPLIFVVQLLKICSATHKQVVPINMCHEQVESLVPSFQSSFLGNHTLYWLKNSAGMSAKQQKWWLSYLSHYTGPNLLICFLPQ